MTQQPDPAHPTCQSSAMSAADTLRDQLLRDMLGDCISLSHIDSVVAHNYSADPRAARQQLLMNTIQLLLTDGLVVVGDIVGGTDATVEPWKVSLEDAVACLHDRYVLHYDSWETWGWTTWFALTKLGKQTAEAL